MTRFFQIFFLTATLTVALVVAFSAKAFALPFQQKTDTTIAPQKIADSLRKDSLKIKGDTLRFPIYDRRSDFLTYPNKNTFNLRDPANVLDSIEYDPATKQYFIVEKVGNNYYRKPTYLTYDEMLRIKAQQDEDAYWRERADMLSALNKKNLQPKLSVTDNLFNRIFGTGKVDIRPQGNVDILAGYQGQTVDNPTLPESARKTGGLDFNMNADVNVLGNIGNKLKLPIHYNTLANFDFENQLKLDYTGGPDEIIKKIEAGNVSFSTKSVLMSNVQSLFGIKTQLQFGKLLITGVLANQRSQQQSLGTQGGAATTNFQFKADDYDENRNFLMAQYFRNNFNNAMKNLPIVNSEVQILRVEVWVTNRNSTTTQAREIVGLMDLGESSPYSNRVHPQTTVPYPDNNANDEYRNIINDPNSRNASLAINKLNSIGLTQVQDFEQVYAKKLDSSAYKFYPQLGFISLTQQLQPNDVLAVAYQYSYNGRIYQVGEFSTDVPPDTTSGNYAGVQKVLYLKLLKATSQRTNLPIWNLMMKNIYTLKTATGSPIVNVQPAGFQLNILYDQPSKGDKRYLPEGDKVGIPLLTVLNLDRLNSHNDPQPDGIFDYLEGYTIISTQGKIIFPFLEPFGHDLDSVAFKNSPAIAPNYVFYQLYDTIKSVAQTYANVDRYIISGIAKGQSTSDISLGAINVPPGSVIVTAGGQTLKENIDYVVDYNLGTVKVINQAILNSGVPVNVSYENNAAFGTQQRSFMGLRFDYLAKSTPTESFSFGGTIERLSERPFFTITNYGEDPIRNTMYGLDFNYRTNAPGITRLLNKLPFYSTKVMSTVTASGESAFLQPGHPPQIGKGSSGTIYIDDFEGSTSVIDMRFPLTAWAMASTPQGDGLFPEATVNDSLAYGFNRAKIAWYNIEPTLQDNTNANNPVRAYQNFNDPRISPINTQQLFPQETPQLGQSQSITFDVAYYPSDKGSYNFEVGPTAYSKGINAGTGKLNNPETRWGGIMRSIDQTDFETNNIQYIEFWMQSPWLVTNPGSLDTGHLYFDIGNVSEDILRDGKRQYENGLPTPTAPAAVDTSAWGRVPLNPIQVTNAFSNNPADRPYQDVGLDGLNDDTERIQFSSYLANLAARVGTGSATYQKAFGDPSNDDFLNYRDAAYDQTQTDILGRYKNYNNTQGNSPIATPGQQYVNASTLYPDQEDLNHDNTLNQLEQYFEYAVSLNPDSFKVGHNYVTDSASFNYGGIQQKWFQFRIPLNAYTQNVGNTPDFRSIGFIRMFLHGFADSMVLRFAELQFIRDSWRSFSYVLDTTGNYTLLPVNSPTTFNVTAVNIEQNSSRTPIPYVIPPGIQRQQQLSTNDVNVLLNEQSMSLQICHLAQGDARGVYKTVNLDLRKYGHLDMFMHAESAGGQNLQDGDLVAVIRLGSDFISNYYEIRIPLKITPPIGPYTADIVWPDTNNLNLALNRLVQLKESRNNAVGSNVYYSQKDASGRTYAILGNPNLGAIQAFFLGVQNLNAVGSACTEVWFDELRLSEISDQGGWAALGRVDINLADLGTMYVSGSYKSAGFGSIDQHINERSLDNIRQLDGALSLQLGKLLPKKTGLSIPMYASISQTVDMPEYDPFDLDIKLKDKLKAAPASERDSIKQQAIDELTIRTLNFTNVRKTNTSGKQLKLWSIENFDLSYSVTKSEHHNSIAEEDELITYKGSLGYNYNRLAKYWLPFRKIKGRSRWLSLLRDFNFNPLPTTISIRADANRQFGAYRSRNIGGPPGLLPETYNKFFNFNRTYTIHWDLTRSLVVDFNAIDRASVDEDSGRLNSYGKKQMWNNFFRGGRNLLYTQVANVSYTFPTSKIPLLDWTIFRVTYGTTYSWTAASLLAQSLGNTLQNSQQKLADGEFDFTRLYSKSKFLRALEPLQTQNTSNKPNIQPNNKTDTSKNKKPQVNIQNQLPQLNAFVKAIGRILIAVKHIHITYSENSSSTIYGYVDSTQAFGMNLRNGEPGLGYVFGKQPNQTFMENLAKRGLITTDTTFNFQNQQAFNQVLNITAQLQPIRNLNIDLMLNKTFGKNYTELFKDTTSSSGFVHLNPYTTGTFSVSFISFQTLFKKFNPNQLSETFLQFENYRSVISARLGSKNPYSGASPGSPYYKGYTQYAQDVLIPAFIAAYTGKDPKTISLINESNSSIRSNPFSGYIPKPNWRITYGGLNHISGLENIFTNLNVSSAYTGTLSMGSFNSSLLYQDPLGIGYAGFIDTTSGNFVPYFTVPNITITEQFSPLIGIDMQFVNKLQLKFIYSKSRQLSLSLIDYQMTEMRSTDITIGFGWKKRGFPLPFNIRMPGKKEASKRLDNDLTLKLDLSLRTDATVNSIIDQGDALPTGGQKTITISPSIDYVLTNRINLKLYYDERRVIPAISSSPPITTVRGGLQIRISLAQ